MSYDTDRNSNTLQPSASARKLIAALGYGLRQDSYSSAWALEHNGCLHSTYMPLGEIEAFAAGIDRTLWYFGIEVPDAEEEVGQCHCSSHECGGNCGKDTADDQVEKFTKWLDDVLDDFDKKFGLGKED